MSEDRITQIRARLDQLPKGTAWTDHVSGFIAHAPADIAWLLAEVERLEKRVRMYEVVKS